MRYWCSHIFFVGLCFFLLSGCATFSTHTFPYGSVSYDVQSKTTLQIQMQDNLPSPISSSVQQKIQSVSSLTIAFYPPDTCVNPAAQMSYSSQRDRNLLQLNCGVMMSRLQNMARRKGFRVISWQQLRGAKRPIDYAKEYGVNFLFELNEMGINKNKTGTVMEHALSFYRTSEEGSKRQTRPLTLTGEAYTNTVQRCKMYFASRYQLVHKKSTVSLDTNMVDVSSGLVLWSYRREVGLFNKTQWTNEKTIRWQARSAGSVKHVVKNPNYAGPIVFIALGAVAGIVGGVGAATRLDPIFTYIGVGGLLAGLTGVPWLIAEVVAGSDQQLQLFDAERKAGLGVGSDPKWKLFYPEGKVPFAIKKPEEVLCVGEGQLLPQEEGSDPVQPDEEASSEGGSSARAITTHTPGKDEKRLEQDQLMSKIINDFLGYLKK